MKRTLSIILSLLIALALTVNVFAAEELNVLLDADHLGAATAQAEELTLADGSITANEVGIFSIILPQNVALDQTVVVHIKGTSEGDFRVWLLANDGAQATFSNQWKASEHDFTTGEFEKYIELTAEDFDSSGNTEADRVAFKAPSWDSTLVNFTLTELDVIYAPMSEVEGNAAEEAQPFLDAANAALEAANAATDEAGVNAALADAEAAVASLQEAASLGFPSVTELLTQAEDVVKQINTIINSAAADQALAAIQSDIDAVNSALEAAKAAGNDIDAINSALESAKASTAVIEEAAKANNSFSNLSDALKNARAAVSEIEDTLQAAKDAKAAEEEAAKKAAEEAEAKKKQQTTIIIIVVVAVVVVAVIAVVVAVVLKKKKK